MRLFRLKSNRTTIVRKDGQFGRIVWTATMEKTGYDATWMMHRWNPKNVIQLTKNQTASINAKREANQ